MVSLNIINGSEIVEQEKKLVHRKTILLLGKNAFSRINFAKNEIKNIFPTYFFFRPLLFQNSTEVVLFKEKRSIRKREIDSDGRSERFSSFRYGKM